MSNVALVIGDKAIRSRSGAAAGSGFHGHFCDHWNPGGPGRRRDELSSLGEACDVHGGENGGRRRHLDNAAKRPQQRDYGNYWAVEQKSGACRGTTIHACEWRPAFGDDHDVERQHAAHTLVGTKNFSTPPPPCARRKRQSDQQESFSRHR